MAKLPSIPGSKVIAALQTFGFEEVRVHSSHHMLKKKGHKFILSVPVHGNEPVAKGTLRAILRGAGIDHESFLDAVRGL